jgi:hypothetical protein
MSAIAVHSVVGDNQIPRPSGRSLDNAMRASARVGESSIPNARRVVEAFAFPAVYAPRRAALLDV